MRTNGTTSSGVESRSFPCGGKKKSLVMTVTAATSVGRVRLTNEDEWALLDSGRFCAIADGMGGCPGGKVASRAVMSFLEEMFDAEKNLEPSLPNLAQMVESVNRRLFQMGMEHRSLKGMGTTFTALWAGQDRFFWAHVGDSRLYRISSEKIDHLSTDHVTYRLRKAPHSKLPHSLAYTYTTRMLTRVIGTQPAVQPEVGELLMKAGEKYLLCTDGLTDRLSNAEIHAVLFKEIDAEKKAAMLVQLANDRGGEDNITLILIDVDHATKNLSRS